MLLGQVSPWSALLPLWSISICHLSSQSQLVMSEIRNAGQGGSNRPVLRRVLVMEQSSPSVFVEVNTVIAFACANSVSNFYSVFFFMLEAMELLGELHSEAFGTDAHVAGLSVMASPATLLALAVLEVVYPNSAPLQMPDVRLHSPNFLRNRQNTHSPTVAFDQLSVWIHFQWVHPDGPQYVDASLWIADFAKVASEETPDVPGVL
ncbi:hypothetical protein EI94DRAFT_1886892 [Lactarius quietus]|nr:hypothetical protein EI94DRAFT_1886892 [Lactarius quietus]